MIFVVTREKRDRENSKRHRIVLSFLASSSLDPTDPLGGAAQCSGLDLRKKGGGIIM